LQQPFQIKDIADEYINKNLSTINGIQDLKISGVENLQMTIQFDKKKCTSLNIDPHLIILELEARISEFSPGFYHSSDGYQYIINKRSRNVDLNEIENYKMYINNVSFSLKDFAKIYISEQEKYSYLRINSKNQITLSIFAKENVNNIQIAKIVKQEVKKLTKNLPAGYEIQLIYDDTEFLEKELHKNYKRTFLSISFLLIFVFIIYRNFKYTFILFLSLILTLAITFIFSYICKVNIHLYSIAGLAISFGIMLDSSIVMLDYYHQYKNKTIFKSLISAILINIFALALIFLLPDDEKNKLYDFSLIIILGLTSSLIVSYWLTPALHDLLFKLYKRKIYKEPPPKNLIYFTKKYVELYFIIISFIANYRKILFLFLIFCFGTPIFLLPVKIENNRWYNNTIGSDYYNDEIKPIIDNLTGGTLRLFVSNLYENSLFQNRNIGKTKLYVKSILPYGSTASQMNNVLIQLENSISNIEGVETYISNVVNGQNGNIEISFKDGYDKTSLPYKLKQKLIKESEKIGGVIWNIYGVGQGFGNKGNAETPKFYIVFKGYNYDKLKSQAILFADRISLNKRIQNINIDDNFENQETKGKQFILTTNNKAEIFQNITDESLFNSLEIVTKPTRPSGIFIFKNKITPIYLTEIHSLEFSVNDLLNSTFSLSKLQATQIKQFGKIEIDKPISNIRKDERQYVRILGCEYLGTQHFGELFISENLETLKSSLPIGFTAEMGNANFKGQNQQSRFILIGLFISIIFCITAILFENLKYPLIVVSMIPISFIGIFTIFSVSDYIFDQGGYASFIMVSGLVTNASIFLINDYNRITNLTNNNKLKYVIINRGRTILLTSIAACCGLIPFLIEGQTEVFWFSFSIGTIGGLIFSLFALFFCLPIILWQKSTK
ncbi:MAG: efflux RND transporter permease subunit, partial [Bacteroidetes bacterium]|nr:efflux RND transporter permease subunit [Bacteroidota bacterium]